MSSQNSSGESSVCDYGGTDLNEELERYRRMTMENIEQLQTTVKFEKYKEETEMNEMPRTCSGLSPIPEAHDSTEMIEEEELREYKGIGFAKAKDCRLEDELGDAIHACKIFRQRAQALLKESAELTRLSEQAVQSDSDDENGSACTSRSTAVK